MEEAAGARGRDHRAVCRRLRDGLRASHGRRAAPERVGGAIEAIRSGVEPSEDPADRVRTPCGAEPKRAGRGEAGDVRLSRIHAHQREDETGRVSGMEADDAKEDAREAGEPEARAATAHARADSRGGPVVGKGARGTLPILRSASEHPSASQLPRSPDPTLVQHAEATEPDGTGALGADAGADSTLAADSEGLSPVARTAVWRCHLRQEPGAGNLHAGIRAGGGPQGPSLPRPR